MLKRKMINIRNSVIIVLSITIICLVLGFIVVSLELRKEKEKNSSFNVIFSKIEKSSSVKGSTVEPKSSVTVDETKKVLHLNFELNAIHDEIIYEAKVKNTGTIPAKIVKLMQSPDYQKEEFAKTIKPITIQISDIEGKVINPKEEVELKIIVYYNSTTMENKPKSFDFNLGLITESTKS